ncbi:gluconate 2-dehydrogenase subunit 3 family protein [Spirosoma sp. 209]|uniref:gluconate 2-dehydrogenase subunit 3 family protein n=1 Tax=Spirosoma sp. 209 TaxID=1955701 RepID=UPI00098D5C22|nr:gluconate 2-dehydrogenase subunit 3 family protein [Spirosoma sp. 209]
MFHPANTIRSLLQTDLVTAPTREALNGRLNAPPRQPTFFSADEFALLQAVCDRLVPQEGREPSQRIDIASGIDLRLSENKSNGWRYDDMPPDGEAYRLGLRGFDESAQAWFGQPFRNLSPEQQDEVLAAVQALEAPGSTWDILPADHFFEELLAEAVENYYSHPLAQEEIGYVGMADAPGWQRIGLNNLEDREKKANSPT